MFLVIAHRGASADAPENTLAAFHLACIQGADMLELDVRRTADGVLVVFHDATTEHWDGQPRPVTACTLAELQQLDIGGERVATLAEVCELACERAILLNVELKQADIVAPTVELLRSYNLIRHTLISSFDAAALRELAQLAPDIPCAYLMGTRTYRPDIRLRELFPFLALRQVRAAAWHPAAQLPLLRWVLPLVRRAGYAINVWTVDDPRVARQLVAWGATGVITNKPALMRESLA